MMVFGLKLEVLSEERDKMLLPEEGIFSLVLAVDGLLKVPNPPSFHSFNCKKNKTLSIFRIEFSGPE